MPSAKCPECGQSTQGDQFLVLIEVKSAPCASSINISERDLEGITVDEEANAEGYLAVLKDDDAWDCGFRFIERNRITHTGMMNLSELPEATENISIQHVAKRWEDWILRPGVIESVYADEHSEIMDNITHFLRTKRNERHLKPIPKDPNRASNLHQRLRQLRKNVLNDPRKEGFLHQSILYHIIRSDPELGCSFHFQNRVGIPDIMARVNRLDS